MTIQTQMTDKDHAVIRARVDRATACFYPASKRIILVADKSDFDAAQAALDELRTYIANETRRELINHLDPVDFEQHR